MTDQRAHLQNALTSAWWSERKHGLSREKKSVSTCVGRSKNLNDLKAKDRPRDMFQSLQCVSTRAMQQHTVALSLSLSLSLSLYLALALSRPLSLSRSLYLSLSAAHLSSRRGVPDLDQVVPRTSDESLPIRRERD